MVNLETTNWLLGAIAVASVVQTLMVVVLGIAGFRFYRQAMAALEELESRHVAPLRRQVDGVLTQVNHVLSEAQSIATRVNHQTERVDLGEFRLLGVHWTFHRVVRAAERWRPHSQAVAAGRTRRARDLRPPSPSASVWDRSWWWVVAPPNCGGSSGKVEEEEIIDQSGYERPSREPAGRAFS